MFNGNTSQIQEDNIIAPVLTILTPNFKLSSVGQLRYRIDKYCLQRRINSFQQTKICSLKSN